MSICFILKKTEQLKRHDHIFQYLDTRGILGLDDVSELCSSDHSFDNSNDVKPVGLLLGVSVGKDVGTQLGSSCGAFDVDSDGMLRDKHWKYHLDLLMVKHLAWMKASY